MSARLGVGIIGMGSIGATHARALNELRDQVTLLAYSGGGPAAAGEAGWPDAVQVAPDDVASQDGVDVVVICSPSECHGTQTLAALRAGRHAVVEKPLAVRVADAERIVELAREQRRQVVMIAQRRFEHQHRAVKELLDAGRLGQLRLATTQVHWSRDDAYYAAAPWRTSMAGGGGSLMNQGVHNVDLLRWLAGPVEAVTAQYATLGHDMDAEDTTVATVRFESGALGMISTSTATPPGDPATVRLHLDRGVIELGQGEVLRWDVDGVEAPPPADSAAPASGAADPMAIGIAGHVHQWRDVVAALTQGRTPAVDAVDAAQTVRLLCAIYEAGATGRAVRPEELS